jgi:epoxyqueuosine reductase
VLREGLEHLAQRLQFQPDQYRVFVDTAPLLERSYARQAGLGWIGKNTCLINEPLGSWFFLGEIVTTVELRPDRPPPDRCGTCTRCIDACPTQALIPAGGAYALDARRCISYLNIELRGPIPEHFRTQMGQNVFGCDICQEVCPWNSRAPESDDFAPVYDPAIALDALAQMSPEEFRETFRHTPVTRAKYHGLLRNVAVGMGNGGAPQYQQPLLALAGHADEMVAEHARWALEQIEMRKLTVPECA